MPGMSNRAKRLRAAVHPGEILRQDFHGPARASSANALALALRVPAPRINDVVRAGGVPSRRKRRCGFARYFGTTL